MWEFEVIRKTAENIFFVAHKQMIKHLIHWDEVFCYFMYDLPVRFLSNIVFATARRGRRALQ